MWTEQASVSTDDALIVQISVFYGVFPSNPVFVKFLAPEDKADKSKNVQMCFNEAIGRCEQFKCSFHKGRKGQSERGTF